MIQDRLLALELAPPGFDGTASSVSARIAWVEWAETMSLAPEGYEAAYSSPSANVELPPVEPGAEIRCRRDSATRRRRSV